MFNRRGLCPTLKDGKAWTVYVEILHEFESLINILRQYELSNS